MSWTRYLPSRQNAVWWKKVLISSKWSFHSILREQLINFCTLNKYCPEKTTDLNKQAYRQGIFQQIYKHSYLPDYTYRPGFLKELKYRCIFKRTWWPRIDTYVSTLKMHTYLGTIQVLRQHVFDLLGFFRPTHLISRDVNTSSYPP